MKFRIIEEAWGINRKTGERKVRRTAERIFTPEAGQIIEISARQAEVRHCFGR